MSVETRRATALDYILSHVTEFKVCDVCERVVRAEARICPECSGYRFDPSPERIVAQAKHNGQIPATQRFATLPR